MAATNPKFKDKLTSFGRVCCLSESQQERTVIGVVDVSSRMTIPEVAHRLSIGRLAVYAMLEQGLLPGIRLGRRWIVTRHAFEEWERTCGLAASASAPSATGLLCRPQHKAN